MYQVCATRRVTAWCRKKFCSRTLRQRDRPAAGPTPPSLPRQPLTRQPLTRQPLTRQPLPRQVCCTATCASGCGPWVTVGHAQRGRMSSACRQPAAGSRLGQQPWATVGHVHQVACGFLAASCWRGVWRAEHAPWVTWVIWTPVLNRSRCYNTCIYNYF